MNFSKKMLLAQVIMKGAPVRIVVHHDDYYYARKPPRVTRYIPKNPRRDRRVPRGDVRFEFYQRNGDQTIYSIPGLDELCRL